MRSVGDAASPHGYRRRLSMLPTLALIGGYVLWNAMAVVAAQPQESYDTYRYFGLVFDIQNPGFITSALFISIEDHLTIIYVLTGIAVIVWSLLALALLYRLNFTWVRWPLAIIILFFSMTTPIWSYNTVLLTESLTVSTLVLWLASIIWVTSSVHSNSLWPLVGLLVAAGLTIFSRPQLLLVIVPIQIVLLIWIARRNQLAGIAWVTGLGLIPFIVVGLYRMYQLSTVQLYQFRYALNNLVDKGSSFRPYALENMPSCEAVPAALNGSAPWNDVHALESTLMNSCPETWIWFNSSKASVQSWVSADPVAAVMDFLGSMTRVQLSVMSEGRAMPEWLSNAILNPAEPWLWMAIYLILGMSAAWIAGVRPRFTAMSVLGVGVSVLSPLAFMFAMWASDGYDISRHIYPALPFIGLALLIFPSVIPSRSSLHRDPSRSA